MRVTARALFWKNSDLTTSILQPLAHGYLEDRTGLGSSKGEAFDVARRFLRSDLAQDFDFE